MKVFALLAFLLLAVSVHARKHTVTVKNDSRYAFLVESFGFLRGGQLKFLLRDYISRREDPKTKSGFVIFRTLNMLDTSDEIDFIVSDRICDFEPAEERNIVTTIVSSDEQGWNTEVTIMEPGLYNIMYASTICDSEEEQDKNEGGSLTQKHSGVSTSFTLILEFSNPGPNYLPAGDMPLPAIYSVMTAFFSIALMAWIWYLRRHKQEAARIHHLMSVLLLVKVVSLLVQAFMYQYIAKTGHNSAWNIMFYIFSFIRGCMMAVVTLLVGAGWSVMRPSLHPREKKVLVVALVLQILANTAIVITEELAPASRSFSAWDRVFILADFLASAAVICPIVWTMKTLKDTIHSGAGSETDHRTMETIETLKTFRNFYIATFAYIYITRFLLRILESSVSFDRTWMVPTLMEFSSLIYFVVVGYKFRPDTENKYLQVSGEDEDEEGDIEMGTTTSTRRYLSTRSGESERGPVQTVAVNKPRNANQPAASPYASLASDRTESAPSFPTVQRSDVIASSAISDAKVINAVPGVGDLSELEALEKDLQAIDAELNESVATTKPSSSGVVSDKVSLINSVADDNDLLIDDSDLGLEAVDTFPSPGSAKKARID